VSEEDAATALSGQFQSIFHGFVRMLNLREIWLTVRSLVRWTNPAKGID
jgi:hypothetical protein